MTLGTPQDVTLQELRIESFFPADEISDTVWRTLTTERIRNARPWLSTVAVQCLATDSQVQCTCIGALHIQDMHRALLHQTSALSQQITYRSLLLRTDVAGRQDLQPQQMRR